MDLSTAQEHLAAWEAADLAASTGQSYSIGGRSLTRANLPEIRDQITYWTRAVDSLMGRSNTLTPTWT